MLEEEFKFSRDQEEESKHDHGRAMYDLIILDIHMPIMNGFMTAHWLRKLGRENKIDLSRTRMWPFQL